MIGQLMTTKENPHLGDNHFHLTKCKLTLMIIHDWKVTMTINRNRMLIEPSSSEVEHVQHTKLSSLCKHLMVQSPKRLYKAIQ